MRNGQKHVVSHRVHDLCIMGGHGLDDDRPCTAAGEVVAHALDERRRAPVMVSAMSLPASTEAGGRLSPAQREWARPEARACLLSPWVTIARNWRAVPSGGGPVVGPLADLSHLGLIEDEIFSCGHPNEEHHILDIACPVPGGRGNKQVHHLRVWRGRDLLPVVE